MLILYANLRFWRTSNLEKKLDAISTYNVDIFSVKNMETKGVFSIWSQHKCLFLFNTHVMGSTAITNI